MLTSSHPESCFCSLFRYLCLIISDTCVFNIFRYLFVWSLSPLLDSFTCFFAASFTSPSTRCSCFTYNPHSGICFDTKLANYSAGPSEFSGGPFSSVELNICYLNHPCFLEACLWNKRNIIHNFAEIFGPFFVTGICLPRLSLNFQNYPTFVRLLACFLTRMYWLRFPSCQMTCGLLQFCLFPAKPR